LIGNAQQFTLQAWAEGPQVDGSPANVIQGWVPLNRLAFWNTREAIEWDRPSTLERANPRRKVRGQILSTARKAKEYLDGPVSAIDSIGLFAEYFDDKSESVPFQPHHMRYPILEWKDGDLRLTDPGEEPRKDLERKYRANELLKVGAIGGYAGLSKTDLEDLRNQLQNLTDMISTSEILFVIDDTGSMGDYFKDVANVVRRITQNAHRTARTVRVAVAFYNDTDERPASWNPVVLLPECFPLKTVTSAGDDVAAAVQAHIAVSGGDPPELVFRGITEAIEGASFSQHARKLVIVVGDCADRLDDPATEDGELAIVKKLLPAQQAPIEFFAVQVCPANRDRFTLGFRRQMSTIVRLLNDSSEKDPRILRALGRYGDTDQDALVKVINDRLADLDIRAAKVKRDLESTAVGDFSSVLGAEYEAILRGAGLNLDKLRGQKGVQLFSEGYVWRYAPAVQRGVPQVRMRVMLEHKTIEDIIRYMTTLVDQQQSLLNRQTSISDALAKLVADATGEKPDPERSVQDQVLKKFGLVARSPLLTKPIHSQFSPKLAYSEIWEIAHRLDLLRDILEKKERDWPKQEVDFAGEKVPKYVPVGEARDFDRHFKLIGSTVRWYWVDMEEELP
jgi:hypothetical protein